MRRSLGQCKKDVLVSSNVSTEKNYKNHNFFGSLGSHRAIIFFYFFLQGRFYLKNRQKPTATLIYTDNIIYNIYTTYIPPPLIINTFSDVKIHVSKVHVHQNSKR